MIQIMFNVSLLANTYLKISRNNPPLDQPNRDTLYLPIQADEFFKLDDNPCITKTG